MITGRPLDPLLAVLSVTFEVTTTTSRPAVPAGQPPTATLVLALSIASTSEQLALVEIVAASGAGVATTVAPSEIASANTMLNLVIAGTLPELKQRLSSGQIGSENIGLADLSKNNLSLLDEGAFEQIRPPVHTKPLEFVFRIREPASGRIEV